MQIITKDNNREAKEHGNFSFLHIQRLREILTFIHENFATDISLDEIAESISLSKSECCRFFKKHMDMTIFDYILYYKIQKIFTQ